MKVGERLVRPWPTSRMPTARLSRMTTTFTWPGYCISLSMRLRDVVGEDAWWRASSTTSGSTMTRTSRPAWMAYVRSTPL